MAHDIFICYSNKDKPYAEEIVTFLEERDIHCWIVPRDIPLGSSWATAIVSAIENSKFMIVIISANSENPQLMREVESAVSNKLTIISFRIEDISPSGALRYFLNDAQWIDAFKPPLQQHLLKLSELILGIPVIESPETSIPTKFENHDQDIDQGSKGQKEEKLPQGSIREVNQGDPWISFVGNFPINHSEISLNQNRRETLQQLHRILALSADTLHTSPRELASQLTGRLMSSANSGVLELLASLEQKVEHPWLRPRNACLPGLNTPILASWSVLDEVPPCRLLISDNSAVVCAISRDRKWFWDSSTGSPLDPLEADPLFPGVDWNLWKRDLPDQQFVDSQIRFKWSATTPPGHITVTCSLERTGSAFNRYYKNQVAYDYHGDLNTLSSNHETSIFASKGFLAPAISSSSNRIICGGLNGVVSIWDLPSGSLESTLYVGTKTIVAITGFPDLKRCAALTLDGQLLIIDPMVNSERKGKLPAFPKDLYLSKDHPIAIVTHVDGSIRIRDTETKNSYLRRPNWQEGSPFATFRITPDLSVAIITGHGEDYYDGWLLNGINLVTGKELFAFETKMSNDTFGEFTLEKHDGKLYLRHDPRNLKTSSNFALSSFTDRVTWICLTSGVDQHVSPTKNGKKVNWARPSFIRGKVVDSEFAPWFTDGSTDEDTVYDEIQLSSNLRTIIAGRSNQQKAQFTMDEEIFLLGISPFDNALVCVIRSIYLLDLVGKN